MKSRSRHPPRGEQKGAWKWNRGLWVGGVLAAGAALTVAEGSCAGSRAISSATEATAYACPMHPEIVSDRPGSCPKCRMALEPTLTRGPQTSDGGSP